MYPWICANNDIDAAIAEVLNPADVSSTNWCGWEPGLDTAAASIGQILQKCGRTTGDTTGQVTAINATVNVNYGSGQVARFTGQIVTTNMSAGGDSSSLAVEAGTGKWIGLLYAGSSTTTIFNPIQDVLSAFNVTPYGSGPPPDPPTAEFFASPTRVLCQPDLGRSASHR